MSMTLRPLTRYFEGMTICSLTMRTGISAESMLTLTSPALSPAKSSTASAFSVRVKETDSHAFISVSESEVMRKCRSYLTSLRTLLRHSASSSGTPSQSIFASGPEEQEANAIAENTAISKKRAIFIRMDSAGEPSHKKSCNLPSSGHPEHQDKTRFRMHSRPICPQHEPSGQPRRTSTHRKPRHTLSER